MEKLVNSLLNKQTTAIILGPSIFNDESTQANIMQDLSETLYLGNPTQWWTNWKLVEEFRISTMPDFFSNTLCMLKGLNPNFIVLSQSHYTNTPSVEYKEFVISPKVFCKHCNIELKYDMISGDQICNKCSNKVEPDFNTVYNPNNDQIDLSNVKNILLFEPDYHQHMLNNIILSSECDVTIYIIGWNVDLSLKTLPNLYRVNHELIVGKPSHILPLIVETLHGVSYYSGNNNSYKLYNIIPTNIENKIDNRMEEEKQIENEAPDLLLSLQSAKRPKKRIFSKYPEFIVKLPYKCLSDDSLIEINRLFDKYEKGDMDISNDSEASLLLHLSVAAEH